MLIRKCSISSCCFLTNRKITSDTSTFLNLWAGRATDSGAEVFRGRSPPSLYLRGSSAQEVMLFQKNWINFQKICVFNLNANFLKHYWDEWLKILKCARDYSRICKKILAKLGNSIFIIKFKYRGTGINCAMNSSKKTCF